MNELIALCLSFNICLLEDVSTSSSSVECINECIERTTNYKPSSSYDYDINIIMGCISECI